MKTPFISVLMGAYNAQQHIQQAILSILAQSYEHFELIIINDGSSDDTLAIIKNIKDERIIIVDQKNIGLTKSLNKALTIAKGELIARQDADDISLSTRFEEQVKAFNQDPDLSLLGSSMYISNPKGVFNEIFHYPCTDEELKEAIFHFNPFIHGAMMIKKLVMISEGGYNESFQYVQDYEFWSRLVPKYKCQNLSMPFYARLREDDCSENQIDKSGFVEEIQATLKKKHTDFPVDINISIKAQSIYPILGWPIRHCSQLAKTFANMAIVAARLSLDTNDYRKKANTYFPWKKY
jgi:glycosyltransferase involved in cell wall biosynthesis